MAILWMPSLSVVPGIMTLTIHEYSNGVLTDSFEVELLKEEEGGFVFEGWRVPAGGMIHVYKLEGDDRNFSCKEIGHRDESDKRIFMVRATFF